MVINIILTLILITALGGSGYYIYRAKKNGQTCIGCPYAKQCNSNNCSCNKKS